ncbi:MAG: hypothetical protein LBG61_01270 [Burkholderiales bacterium]|jgi:hypothetical protein|nr:hypothetical protein [Burkholderiales bacterium]
MAKEGTLNFEAEAMIKDIVGVTLDTKKGAELKAKFEKYGAGVEFTVGADKNSIKAGVAKLGGGVSGEIEFNDQGVKTQVEKFLQALLTKDQLLNFASVKLKLKPRPDGQVDFTIAYTSQLGSMNFGVGGTITFNPLEAMIKSLMPAGFGKALHGVAGGRVKNAERDYCIVENGCDVLLKESATNPDIRDQLDACMKNCNTEINALGELLNR